MRKHLVLALVLLSLSPIAYAQMLGTSWRITGSMNNARRLHTATLLPDGSVLVAGGFMGLSNLLNGGNTAEIYQPVAATWRFTRTLRSGRARPASGTWSTNGDANSRFVSSAALLLPTGKVLLSEGENSQSELYDHAKRTWTLTGKALAFREQGYTTTLLSNGKALLAGGYNYDLPVGTELYDFASGMWSSSGNMNTGRYGHTATLLSNGTVLVAGGAMEGSTVGLMSAELFEPGGSGAIGIEFQR